MSPKYKDRSAKDTAPEIRGMAPGERDQAHGRGQQDTPPRTASSGGGNFPSGPQVQPWDLLWTMRRGWEPCVTSEHKLECPAHSLLCSSCLETSSDLHEREAVPTLGGA